MIQHAIHIGQNGSLCVKEIAVRHPSFCHATRRVKVPALVLIQIAEPGRKSIQNQSRTDSQEYRRQPKTTLMTPCPKHEPFPLTIHFVSIA